MTGFVLGGLNWKKGLSVGPAEGLLMAQATPALNAQLDPAPI
jgi:hypothetical protein